MTTATIPVTPYDRVSDVLARDESLVEVFVRHAPHFARLRHRAMRRVMARLLTVEQAARTADIPVTRLVNDLNAALGFAAESSRAAPLPHSASAASASGGQHPESATVIELDVRDDLRSGREPFSRIMSAIADLRGDGVLRLRAIFEPAPLFAVLGKRGFAHESTEHAADDWSVWFWRPQGGLIEESSGTPSITDAADVPNDDERTVYLDVRGLGAPEPMVRTLAALESLTPGRTLVQINNRIPQFLFPALAERGFAWEIDESGTDRVLVRISHAR